MNDVHPLIEFWWFFRKNKGAVFGIALVLGFTFIALLGPWIAGHDPAQIYPEALRLPPFWTEGAKTSWLLGTDDVGRDLFSRLVYGARVSLSVGFMVVFMSMSAGVFLGLVAGYFGGWLDGLIMRAVDILMSMPSILLAIVVVAILGPSLFNAVIAVSIVTTPGFVRLVRATVMGEKNKQYVIASRSFGAGPLRNMFINILPNCMAPLIVQASLSFGSGILDAAALGFLGLGAQPPTPEWGTMLADSRPFIESNPWMVTLPGLCILLVVLGFNLFGDGLRDAFDPKLRK